MHDDDIDERVHSESDVPVRDQVATGFELAGLSAGVLAGFMLAPVAGVLALAVALFAVGYFGLSS